jgi:hypothetical protein
MSLKISELIDRLEAVKANEGDLTLHSVNITRVTFLELGLRKIPRYSQLMINRSALVSKK